MNGTANPDLLQVLINVSGAFPAIFTFIQILFAFVGVLLFGFALLDLYAFGNPNSGRFSGNHVSPGSITWRFVVATVLTGSVWMLGMTQNTLAGADVNSGAMVYQSAGLSPMQQAAIEAVMGAFTIVGYIGFGRGWYLLDKHFNGGKDGVGGPIAYIIGGTMAVYMDVWLPILSKWTGFDFVNILLF